MPQNPFYEASITLIQKLDKSTEKKKEKKKRKEKKRKLQANIPEEHSYENPQQNISKPSSAIH